MADQKLMKKRLKALMDMPGNQVCSDCTERQPRWTSLIVPPPGAPAGSLPIGAFCCLECSGSHRRLGVHISFVRSINLDSWKEKEVQAMENGGNVKVNAIFEANLNVEKPTNHADLNTRERFIRDKYERRKFYDPSAFGRLPREQPAAPSPALVPAPALAPAPAQNDLELQLSSHSRESSAAARRRLEARKMERSDTNSSSQARATPCLNSASKPKAVANEPAASTATPADEFAHLTWETVTIENGDAIGCYGKKWSEYTVDKLRKICGKLSVRGIKNTRKDVIIQNIQTFHKNQGKYSDILKLSKAKEGKADAPQKQVQCPFRLLNILFSDDFSADFAKIGNVADRATLDSGKAANDEYFWIAVQAAFVDPGNQHYDHLNFQLEEDIFEENDHIDPSKIVPHDWKSLRKIWKGLNAEYKAAQTRFAISGTHDSCFYSFCNGRLDVFYLRKYLETRPGLSGMVLSNLPDDNFVSTDMSERELDAKFLVKSNNSSMLDLTDSERKTDSDRKRKRSAQADIASAIRDLGSSQMIAELAKHKISLLVKEESWKEQENARKEQENARNKEKDLFDLYETIQKNIRLLRQDLQDPSLDDEAKADINKDLKGFLKKKQEIASKIGFN